MITSKKIDIFKKLFRGRQDVYGSSEGKSIKGFVSDTLIKRHLDGKEHIGIYPVMRDNNTHFVVIDIDEDNIDGAFKYKEIAKRYSINAYVEVSKKKGYHVWIFFQEPIESGLARNLAKKLIDESGLSSTTEIFPKQDELNGGIGNYINVPLNGASVLNNRTIFIEQGYSKDNQWELLNMICTTNDHSTRITRKHLLSVIDYENGAVIESRTVAKQSTLVNVLPCLDKFVNGVQDGARDVVSLAYSEHLRRKGLPLQQAIELIELWNEKNTPPIKGHELKKLRDNVKRVYSGDSRINNFQCENPIMQQFCPGKDNCPIHNKRTDIQSTDLDKLIDECKEKAFNSAKYRGIYFGFNKLDNVMDGLQFHNAYFLGAKTNVGKTSFCVNIAHSILINQNDVKVIYFSLDDGEHIIIQRLVALLSGLTIGEVEKFDIKILQSMLSDEDKATKTSKLNESFDKLKKYSGRLKLYGIEHISTIDDMEKIIEKEAVDSKVVVIIDMLHSVKDSNYSKNDRRYQLIELSRRIKIIKARFRIAFLSVVEIRKSAKEGREGLELEDISETAKIGYDANAIFLMEEDKQVDGEIIDGQVNIVLKVAKNKTSSFKGNLYFNFKTAQAKFEEI